ncbi:MAG: hypothetical protein DRP93_01420, partial [Candidatus Neomarinimicrobiota bacterium]
MVAYGLYSSVVAVTADTTGFSVKTDCHAVFFNNLGDDDAKIYFNDDSTNYYPLKSGATYVEDAKADTDQVSSTMKIVFETTASPLITIVKQTKQLL